MMDNYFHLVWMRQSFQFSHMPFYTLLEMNRIMKVGGWAYVEVPHSAINTNIMLLYIQTTTDCL